MLLTFTNKCLNHLSYDLQAEICYKRERSYTEVNEIFATGQYFSSNLAIVQFKFSLSPG